MIQGLKLLGYYIEQDKEEESIVKELGESISKFLIGENRDISTKYEILKVNSLSDKPNEISISLKDSSGQMKNIILPISVTKYINQTPDSIHKILLKLLDEILNKSLIEIANEYQKKGKLNSYRAEFLNDDPDETEENKTVYYDPDEMVENKLNKLKKGIENFKNAIKDYKLLREDDGIYLEYQNTSIKLPDSMVKKLQLLGFYDEKEEALFEKIVRESIHSLILSEFYHDQIFPDDCIISEFSTLGDVAPDVENTEKYSSLDGLAVYVTQNNCKDEGMFNKKGKKDEATTIVVPYEFLRNIIQRSNYVFKTEREIAEKINELFLGNTQKIEINSEKINAELQSDIIQLHFIKGKEQFVARKGKSRVCVDKKTSRNILQYMKSEITSVAERFYTEESKRKEVISVENSKENTFEDYIQHLLTTYRFMEELNKRGYMVKKGMSTEIVDTEEIFVGNLSRIVLNLPYINKNIEDIDKLFNSIVRNVDSEQLLMMEKFIQLGGPTSHYDEYKQSLNALIELNKIKYGAKITLRQFKNGTKNILTRGMKEAQKIIGNFRKPHRYTLSRKDQPPTIALEQVLNQNLIGGYGQLMIEQKPNAEVLNIDTANESIQEFEKIN